MNRPTFRVLDIVWASVVVSLGVALYLSETERRKLKGQLLVAHSVCLQAIDKEATLCGYLYTSVLDVRPEDAVVRLQSLKESFAIAFRNAAARADGLAVLEGWPRDLQRDFYLNNSNGRAGYRKNYPELQGSP